MARRSIALLDVQTLLTVTLCVACLLGLFLVVVWVQERSIRALLWWSAGYFAVAAAVFALSLAPLPLWMANRGIAGALLCLACGAMWSGIRAFHGRRLSLPGLLGGALVWLGLIAVSDGLAGLESRVTLASLIIAVYAVMTAYELQQDRRKATPYRLIASSVMLVQAGVFLSPIPLNAVWRPAENSREWLALIVLSMLLYLVATAFVIVVMVKQQVVLLHKTAAMTDPLTGLFNRRAFFDAAQAMMARQAKKRAPVSLLAFDLDRFKSINDRFGHATGDDALRLFAATASATLRATDVLGRIGGEEFVALIPGGAQDAAIAAERVRAAYEIAGVEIAGHRIGSTVSIGLSSGIPPLQIALLMEQADAALYRAKAQGRNRVERADQTAAQAEPMLSISAIAA